MELPSRRKKVGQFQATKQLDDGFVLFDEATQEDLEECFQEQGSAGYCSIMRGKYIVDFKSMKQKKTGSSEECCVRRGELVWCWMETDALIPQHDTSMLMGDGFVRYDAETNKRIESAYQTQSGKGTYSPLSGYSLDFEAMRQTNKATNFQRQVKRMYFSPADKKTDSPPLAPKTSVQTKAPAQSLQHAPVALKWIPANGTLPDGTPAFKKHNDKSTTTGVTSNPKMDGYMFGNGSEGLGYYHYATKDAYQVAYNRIFRRYEAEISNLQCVKCCCGGKNQIARQEEKVEELRRLLVDAKRNIASAGPRTDHQTRWPQSSTPDVGWSHAHTTGWYFPEAYCQAGAACGACGPSGGGCGGGGGTLLQKYCDKIEVSHC